jgi:hypothetical protein
MSCEQVDFLRAKYKLGVSGLLGKGMEAEAYAYECGDGYYRWCLGNLNNPAYWAGLA